LPGAPVGRRTLCLTPGAGPAWEAGDARNYRGGSPDDDRGPVRGPRVARPRPGDGHLRGRAGPHVRAPAGTPGRPVVGLPGGRAAGLAVLLGREPGPGRGHASGGPDLRAPAVPHRPDVLV